ncbi:MAG: MnhB domain-containing protein [Rubricella sp.]
MNSIILTTATRALVPVLVVMSFAVLLRGHNDPGGGFIGGLLAALAVALLEKAHGPAEARRWLRLDPLAIAGAGLAAAILAGFWGAVVHGAFLTGVWPFYGPGPSGSNEGVPAGSILLFDLGVYLVVVGAVSAILIALEEAGIPPERPVGADEEDEEEDA